MDRAIVIAEKTKAGANLGYVALSREKHHLEIITDDKENLAESWGKYVQQESARDAAMRGTLQTAKDEAREFISYQQVHARAEERTQRETPEREKARVTLTANNQLSPAYDPGIGW